MIDPQKLACLLACYETDEPHVDLPQCPASNHYPEVDWKTLQEQSRSEHAGDCTNEPQTCLRCWAEMIVHKAKWISERMV